MREIYEKVLKAHAGEQLQVTAALAVIATLDDIAWLDNRLSLNDRGTKLTSNGQRRNHKTETASRQYWKGIGREAAGKLKKQMDLLDVSVGPPYRFIVYYGAREMAGRDSVNLTPTTKAIIDGLVWGELLPDDNYKWVSGQDSRMIFTDSYRMEVTVHMLATVQEDHDESA